MTGLREAAQQALEQVQEFKRRWWLVPAFGNKVNKATREAITSAHSPIFELEHALRAALAQQAEPVCRCDLRTRLVGDGCEVCNPKLAAELAQQAEPVRAPRGIRMERVDKSTSPHWWSESARIKAPSPELYAAGDTVLCWVNEGDMLMAQQAEPDHETRAELAEQQVVQLAEERDHYRNLWQRAQQAEPVAWMLTDAYNPKVRFLEWTQQPKGYRGDWIKTPLYTASPRHTLSELVKGMQPGDMPADKEWDAAPPVGREEGSAK